VQSPKFYLSKQRKQTSKTRKNTSDFFTKTKTQIRHTQAFPNPSRIQALSKIQSVKIEEKTSKQNFKLKSILANGVTYV
jgi:hypothetical protein